MRKKKPRAQANPEAIHKSVLYHIGIDDMKTAYRLGAMLGRSTADVDQEAETYRTTHAINV